jgi:hypothetical protein
VFKTESVNNLEPRIKAAVHELLYLATKNQKNPNDIVLFLSNGFFDPRFKDSGLTGYMLGPGEVGWDDVYRKEFFGGLSQFWQRDYSCEYKTRRRGSIC